MTKKIHGTKRPIAIMTTLAMLLTACGNGSAGTETTTAALAETPTTAAATTAEEPSTSEATASTTASASDEVTVTHSQGEATVPYQPETVVVFEYAALDTMDALGIEATGVVKSTLPAALSHYSGDEYADMGSLFEPDYEAINELDPDLIIVGGRSAETLPEMEEIAPAIDLSYDWENFTGSFEQNTRTLGTIFGVEDEVEDRLATVQASIDEVSSKAADAGNALIVMTSASEVTAFGPGSRFGLIHDLLGVSPAVEDVEQATHGDAIGFEFILEANPSILYVIDRDAAIGDDSGQPAEVVLDNELVAQTDAAENDKIIYLEPSDWYLTYGGLGALERMLDDVGASLD